jgi:hypothetical protein
VNFSDVHREPEELSYLALRARIHQLSQQGIDPSGYLVALQMKLAVPFASSFSRGSAYLWLGGSAVIPCIAATLGAGLLVGAGYWVILAFGKSLGDTTVLPAIPAAWSANALYLLLGGVLFLSSEVKRLALRVLRPLASLVAARTSCVSTSRGSRRDVRAFLSGGREVGIGNHQRSRDPVPGWQRPGRRDRRPQTLARTSVLTQSIGDFERLVDDHPRGSDAGSNLLRSGD